MKDTTSTKGYQLAAAVLVGTLLTLSGCSSAQPSGKPAAGRQPQPQEQSGPAPAARSQQANDNEGGASKTLPLIPANATLDRARELIKDPNTNPLPKDPKLAEQVKLGYQIFMNTPKFAPQYSGNDLSCTNCHMNGGQRERALPMTGIAAMFPEYNNRAGRRFSLEERIVGCFLRSMNATDTRSAPGTSLHENGKTETWPSPRSREVLVLSAYITWLSEGQPVGKKPVWRGQNTIPKEKLIPIDRLDPNRGRELYGKKCAHCHGQDGQGVQLTPDLKPGPLWGPRSWNDGAGAARVYTLAGFLRYAMPLDAPGSLTDEEAQLGGRFSTKKS